MSVFSSACGWSSLYPTWLLYPTAGGGCRLNMDDEVCYVDNSIPHAVGQVHDISHARCADRCMIYPTPGVQSGTWFISHPVCRQVHDLPHTRCADKWLIYPTPRVQTGGWFISHSVCRQVADLSHTRYADRCMIYPTSGVQAAVWRLALWHETDETCRVYEQRHCCHSDHCRRPSARLRGWGRKGLWLHLSCLCPQ